jgi:hypothetical protein
MLRSANAHGVIAIPTEEDILYFYAQVQGYSGRNDAASVKSYLAQNDNGADELTVIKMMETMGLGAHYIVAYSNLVPSYLDHIKWAIQLFGCSRLGLNLPISAMDQFSNGQAWTPVDNAQLDGGHDVPAVKYDADGTVWVVTWGQLFRP